MHTREGSPAKVVSEAFNKLYQFNAALRAKKRTAPTRSLIFHYTTVDGLRGIIERNYLQASSAYFLNDSSEITYGSRVVCDALKEWQSKNRYRRAPLAIQLARELQELFARDVPGETRMRPVYVACFCEDDNLLSQWRAYGQAGGYSLGFRMASGRGGMQPEPNIYTAEWVKVEYREKEQLASCNAILDAAYQFLVIQSQPRHCAVQNPTLFLGTHNFVRTSKTCLLMKSSASKTRPLRSRRSGGSSSVHGDF